MKNHKNDSSGSVANICGLYFFFLTKNKEKNFYLS